MATLTMTKALRRLVNGGQWGPLTVVLAPEGVYLKERRRRKLLGPVSWGAIFQRAGEIEARRIRAEREAARAAAGKPPRTARTKRGRR